MKKKHYKNIIQHLDSAYAYYKIICSDDGLPCDCEFIEVNTEFERLIGLREAEIAGKLISEVLPGIKTDKFDWISFFGDVALNRSEREFEQYVETLKQYFRVKVFSPKKYFFATLLDALPIDKKSLDAILADQEYFELRSDNDPGVVLTIRMNDQMVINVNRRFTESLGYSHSEFIGKSCLETGLCANPDQFREVVDELRIHGSIINKEITFRQKDGGEFIGLMSGTTIYIGDDSNIFNSIRNINDREQLEDELIASEIRYRRLFESAKDGILILEADTGCIIDVNQFLIDLLGYSKEQFMDKTIWDIGFFKDIVESQENYLELLKNEYIRYEDLPLRTTSGRSIRVEFVSNVYIEDELKVVQCNIRDITERFEAKQALQISESKFENYIENAPFGVFISDADGLYLEVNKMASEITGYSMEQLLTMTIGDITCEESLTTAYTLFAVLKEKGKMSGELLFKHRSGLKRWWTVDAVKISDQRFLGFSQDITDRKKADDSLFYLGYHDQLTGLYNRRYFENAIGKIDVDENLPISLIICDINGLKIANDSFGHTAGNALLVHAANVLKEIANPGDFVARIGGDEFILISPRMDSDTAKGKIEEIKNKAISIEVHGMHLSLSFGSETKTSNKQTFMETLANAENHMYRHKLFEVSSLRSKTIDVIMQTLFEKSDREMMHSKRVSEICQAIATAMHFEGEVIDRIRIAGLVHDIGKVGINESILNKPASLNDNEWNEMKKHPEIGWRILSAANEFFDLANCVLCHHERWDGFGYPNGTKAEGIPMESRIVALADAFDAMTSMRTYRDQVSDDQAIAEIKRCSGTHFDPSIVEVFVNKIVLTGHLLRASGE